MRLPDQARWAVPAMLTLALAAGCRGGGGGSGGSGGEGGEGGGQGQSQGGTGGGHEAPGSPIRVPDLQNPPVSQRSPGDIRTELIAAFETACRAHGWESHCVKVVVKAGDLPDFPNCLGHHLEPAPGATLQREQTVYVIIGSGPCDFTGGPSGESSPDPGSGAPSPTSQPAPGSTGQ